MAKFEYKVVILRAPTDAIGHEQTLNELGEQGWELVTVVCEYRGGGFYHLVGYLKRTRM